MRGEMGIEETVHFFAKCDIGGYGSPQVFNLPAAHGIETIADLPQGI